MVAIDRYFGHMEQRDLGVKPAGKRLDVTGRKTAAFGEVDRE